MSNGKTYIGITKPNAMRGSFSTILHEIYVTDTVSHEGNHPKEHYKEVYMKNREVKGMLSDDEMDLGTLENVVMAWKLSKQRKL